MPSASKDWCKTVEIWQPGIANLDLRTYNRVMSEKSDQLRRIQGLEKEVKGLKEGLRIAFILLITVLLMELR